MHAEETMRDIRNRDLKQFIVLFGAVGVAIFVVILCNLSLLMLDGSFALLIGLGIFCYVVLFVMGCLAIVSENNPKTQGWTPMEL